MSGTRYYKLGHYLCVIQRALASTSECWCREVYGLARKENCLTQGNVDRKEMMQSGLLRAECRTELASPTISDFGCSLTK
jgi:hypothetical protein